MWLMLLAPLASAAMPLPGYDDALARGTYQLVDHWIADSCTWSQADFAFACNDDIDRAVERATEFQRVVTPDAGLEYLIGLAWRYKGDDDRAERAYRSALALDPDRADAWYDLGELLLLDADLDAAEQAFARVAELMPAGDRGWVGPWRLAEVAAHRRDPIAFERHMREALRRGFSFRQIEGLPNWKRFYADPALRDSIAKLINVYGDAQLLESLEAP